MRKFLMFCGLVLGAAVAAGAESGDSVVVIYNSRVPESKQVAEYYADRRSVPKNQLLGLNLPPSEQMTRAQFREDLQKPFLNWLEKNKFFVFKSEVQPAANGQPAALRWKLSESKIRYAVVCYGVPLKISRDLDIREPGAEQLPEVLRQRNEASVESELALLPLNDFKLPLTGPLQNPFHGVTNAAALHPTNGVLMIARLDGPSPEIARALVDKALEAETNGLWGRGYFDLRGLTEGEYALGDTWIRNAAMASRHYGIDTVIDEKPQTFSASFPMSQIAVYAGWYDEHVSGPFTSPYLDLMPGAIAYHLHSYSAATLRSTNRHWAGPLLSKGVAATLGSVDEPYLGGTPDIGTFFARLMFLGFSFGEAAYAGQGNLSWQTTVIGDPLYRPFARPPQELHEDLLKRNNKLIEWSHLRVANLNLVLGYPTAEVVEYLESQGKGSAVLTEKLADLYAELGKPESAIRAYAEALKLVSSPQQEIRLRLILSEKLLAAGDDEKAFDVLFQIPKKFANHSVAANAYEKLLPIARKLNKKAEAEQIQSELQRLTPAPATAPAAVKN